MSILSKLESAVEKKITGYNKNDLLTSNKASKLNLQTINETIIVPDNDEELSKE